jgi:hypothetical protein
MSEETNEVQLTDEEAQARIKSMFIALDAIYALHGPDLDSDPWVCKTCSNCDGDVSWPCETEKIILNALGVIEA